MPDKDYTNNVLRMVTTAALLHVLHLGGSGSVLTNDVASYLDERKGDLALLDMSLTTSDSHEARDLWATFKRLEEGHRLRMLDRAVECLAAAAGCAVSSGEVAGFVFDLFEEAREAVAA